MTTLPALTQRARSLIQALNHAYYLNYSGQDSSLGFEAIYAGSATLFRPESFALLQEAIAAERDPISLVGLHNLYAFLSIELTESLSGAARERVIERSMAPSIPHGDSEAISLRDAQALLPTLDDRGGRENLEARMDVVIDACNADLAQQFDRLDDVAGQLGHPSYLQMIAAVQRFDLDAVADDAEQFLAHTEDAYRDVMDWFLRRRCGVGLDDARYHDIAHLGRASWMRSRFPASQLVSKAEACLGEMGLDLSDAVHLDLEARENKVSRAFCAPVEIPGQIYLSLRQRGGYEDYRAFYHELGHALHFAHIDPELPFGATYLGDDAITEGYAFLFEYLVHRPLWLKRYLRQTIDGDDRRFFAVQQLMLLRRYCGKLIYERGLYKDGPRHSTTVSRYVEVLGKAMGVQINPAYYLLDVDPHFYCVNYLRAWRLENLLSDRLIERFDEQWYRMPEAGTFLKALWARGQSQPADAIASTLGAQSLEVLPLAAKLVASVQ